jgi:hypothetical protein
MPAATDPLAAALDLLDRLADGGDNLARHAANILRGRPCGGRREIDDEAALAKVRELRAAGRSREAIGIVASTFTDNPQKAATVGRRLRDKMKRRKGMAP